MVRKFVIIGFGFNEIEVSGLKVVKPISAAKELKFHAHQYKRPRANHNIQ
jgi:hypothetical protein